MVTKQELENALKSGEPLYYKGRKLSVFEMVHLKALLELQERTGKTIYVHAMGGITDDK
jgi:hypothetical protein